MTFDLSKIKLENKKLLVRDEEYSAKVKKINNKKNVDKRSEKGGRPMLEDEPLNMPFTINFTQTELQKIKDKAGDVPVAKYLRGIIKNAGFFN